MNITRDDNTWLYTVDWGDGRQQVMPSVTTVIDTMLGTFDGLPAFAMERVKNAGDFGRAVHTLTELDDKGDLDTDNLDVALLPILQAWQYFKDLHEPEFHHIEMKIAGKIGYAGTIDRIATLKGKKVVLEIKSRQYKVGRDGLQTIAYQKAYEEMTGKKIDGRYVIELKLDGTFKLTKNTCWQDWDIFRSCLAMYQWRKNHA